MNSKKYFDGLYSEICGHMRTIVNFQAEDKNKEFLKYAELLEYIMKLYNKFTEAAENDDAEEARKYAGYIRSAVSFYISDPENQK